MTQSSRTFRIFVSSTFSDLKAERNTLQEKVFPRLRDLAMAHGCRFQAIDLRWGVSEEAALDQQTMNICLGEIARCQKISPRPNFIVLLGDRYGWRPLPYAIPAEEFERLLPHLTPADQTLACWREDESGWYRRDDNAVPPEYILQPREKGTRYEKYFTWESEVERPLVAALDRAALQAGLDGEARVKYTHSATGQEIADGALKVKDARGHVFGFFRSISNVGEVETLAEGKAFVEADLDLQQRQQDLKARLKQCLPGNIHEYEAQWQNGSLSAAHIGSLPATLDDCLKLNDAGKEPKTLCEAVWLRLSQVILAEAGKLEAMEALQREQAAHHEFGQERARLFVGREDVLSQIADYQAGSDNHPLAVWGESGSGKSALLAKAVQQAQEKYGDQVVLVARFIGATPESSNGRALLDSLCHQITLSYGGDESTIPQEYRDLVQEFPKRLALATQNEPLVIFLDALDQLSDSDHARNLIWFPAELPPHVKLVVSTLPGGCQTALQRRLSASSLMSVPALSKLSGESMLQRCLAETQRTLTEEQRADILTKFERGGGLPLYLKLAFEEARLWHAYDGLPALSDQAQGLSEDTPGVIRNLFWRLEQESNHGQVLVSHALGYLAAARNGLSEDEVLDVLWRDEEVRNDFFRRSPKSPQDIVALPVVIWARLFLDLEPYLAFRKADGAELMTFYHRQVAEVVLEKVSSGSEKHNRHLALADYFEGQKLWYDVDHGIPNHRKTSELPYQQAYAGLDKDLVATLTRFEFLRAKLAATNPQALIEDFGLYLVPEAKITRERSESLSLIHSALMLSMFALARGKDLLAGQLFGRLGGFSQPEILQLLLSARHWTDHPWLRPICPCLPPPGGALIRTLGKHDSVRWIQITPEGRRAISCSSAELKIWDLANGICEQVFGVTETGKSFAITFSPDRYKVVTTTTEWDEDGPLRSYIHVLEILDLEAGTCIKRLRSHKNPIVSVAITPDGSRALSASRIYKSKDNTLKVWDVESSRCIRTIEEEAEKVLISSNGRRGISMTNAFLKIWNLESGKCIRVVEDWQGLGVPTIITPDDRRIIFLGRQGHGLKVLDLNNGKDLYLLEGPQSGMRNFAITPDGKRGVSESRIIRNQQGIDTLQIWDLDTGECIRVLEGIKGILAIFPDGEKALDSWLRIWDLRSGVCLRKVSPQHYEAKLISITPDGKQAVTSSERDNALRLWDLENNGASETYEGHAEGIAATALVPGNHQVVSSSEDKTLKLWDLRTGNHLSDLSGHRHWVRVMATTPDGRCLISGSDDNTLRVWDLQTSQCLHTLWSSKNLPIHALSVSPDGQQVLSGASNTLEVWDFSGEKPQQTFMGLHRDVVNWTAITPDGRLGISASSTASNHEVMIWDLKNRCFLRALACQHFSYAAMLPDGRRLLTSDNDTVNVWDLDTGECLRKIDVRQGHYSASMTAIMPDARQVAVYSRTTLGVFDLETGKCVHMSSGKDDRSAQSGAVSADGRRLVAEHYDGLVEIWDLESGKKLTEFIGEGIGGGRAVISDNTIFYGDQTGRVYFLRLENVTPGAPVITAWRDMPNGTLVAFGCPHCRTWSEVSASALSTELPCPNCGKQVRLNPFTIQGDWKPIAEAWQKSENKR